MKQSSRSIYFMLVIIWGITVLMFIDSRNPTRETAKNSKTFLPLLLLAAIAITFFAISRIRYDLMKSSPPKVVNKSVKALPGEFHEIARIEGTTDVKLNLELTADASRSDEIYTLQVRNHKHYVIYKDEFCPVLKQHRSDHIFKKEDLPLTFVIRSDWGQEAVVNACITYREAA